MSVRSEFEISRRRFIEHSLAAGALAGLPAWFAKEAEAAETERVLQTPRRIGANDAIHIGVIGPGGSKGGFRQGLGDTRGIASKPGVKCIAVCDLDDQHRDEAANIFGPDTKKYHDYRELLANKEIDAVVIGTPDHWHTTIANAAMNAGKDVYCEKPLTLTIAEGKSLVATQKRTGRVFQVGSQQRSDARFRMACELVRNGRVGKLKRAEAHLPAGPTGGPFPVLPVPSDFDWDMWIGPAPQAEYVKERTHGTFRHWLDYSGGMMTDWGAHHNDIAQWGIGADGSGPIAIEPVRGTRPVGHNCYNAFNEFEVNYYYPHDVALNTSSKGENGVLFEGESGWIFVSRGVIKASDDRLLSDPLPGSATKLYASNDHHGNFVDCIRSRKPTICPAEVGHRSVSVCHLGNLALRLADRRLEWDPKTETFKNDPEANAMLSRPARKQYKS